MDLEQKARIDQIRARRSSESLCPYRMLLRQDMSLASTVRTNNAPHCMVPSYMFLFLALRSSHFVSFCDASEHILTLGVKASMA